MPFLTIDGITVPVAQGQAIVDAPTRIGSSQRMFAGNLRSSVRAEKRSWRVTTKMLTEAESLALRNAVKHGVFVLCSGDMLESTRSVADLFRYDAGDTLADSGGVHTRADASTCASYRDADGVLRYAAANVLRDAHYIGGVRHTLLEYSVQNRCLRSEDFANAYYSATRCSVSSNTDIAPDGTMTADRIVEDSSAANTHFLTSTSMTVLADVVSTASIFLKQSSTRGWARLQFVNGAARYYVYVNLATGATGQSAGEGTGTFARARVEEWSSTVYGRYWRVLLSGSLGGGLTSGVINVHLANADGGVTYSGNGASYVVLWGAQVETGYGSSYMPTVASALSRAADVVEWNWDHVPQEMTAYLDVTAADTFLSTGASKNLFNIGTNLGTDPRFGMQAASGGGYQCYYDDATTQVFVGAGSPTFGQRAEMRAALSFDSATVWRLTPAISIAGAAETGTTGGTSGPSSVFAGAPDTKLRFQPSSPVAYRSLVIAPGIHTLAVMRGRGAIECEVIVNDSGFVHTASGVKRPLSLTIREV